MEMSVNIEIAGLDSLHRRALEEVIGRPLSAHQRLVISVAEEKSLPASESRPAQTLEDWTRIYDGLSDAEVDEIDEIVKARADVSRNAP